MVYMLKDVKENTNEEERNERYKYSAGTQEVREATNSLRID